MEYLENIGSYLPDLPDLSPAVQSVWQGWQQVTQIDSLYLAVAGGFLLFSLVVIIAIKKWKARQSQKSQNKSHEKQKPKPQGIKNIKNEEAEKSKPSKWKKPDSKPSVQKPEEKSKSTWFGGLTEKITSVKEEIIPNTATKPAEQKKGWFSSSQPEKSKVSNPKSNSAETRDSFMKPVHLNIDPNPVPKDVLKKKTEGEIQRVRRMCGEFREVVKGNNKEEREEKQKEMEKVRSARSYFKTADRYRSESLSGNPRIKFRTEEEVTDSYSRGNQNRLSQFTPGKINSRFTDMFGGEQEPDLRPQKAPKKKIITLNQVLKQESPKSDENRISKELELEDLKESRKKWKPPKLEKPEPISNVKDEIITLQFESVPLKLRWNPTDNDDEEKIKTLEIPNKLNLDKVFPNQSKEEDAYTKMEVEKELDELRLSRPKRFQRIGKEERSSSAHVLQRVKLPDDSWVVEKSESRIKEERKRAIEELELVKQARMETLEAMENMEIERPSSRLEDQVRYEAMKELEEVRRVRTVSMQEEEVKSDVAKILENQLIDEGQMMPELDSKVIVNVIDTTKEEQQTQREDSEEISLQEVIDNADDMKEIDQKIIKHVSFEEDTQVKIDAVVNNEPVAEEDSDETLSTSVDSQINLANSNQMENEGDQKVAGDADDSNGSVQVVSNQITDDSKKIDEEKSRLRSEEVNVKEKELEMPEKEMSEEEQIEESQDDVDTEEQLVERVKELTESGDIRSLDIAMAIAAEGMLEFEEFKGTQSYKDETYEELDEDFEEKKKKIEEELRLIEEQYKAVQEQASQDVTAGSEVITPAESYEELTERLLKVAESIQDSAKRLGNEDIDLSPRIDRIQSLRDECQLSNQSLPVKDNFGENVTTETDAKANLQSIKSDSDKAECVKHNGDLETLCLEIDVVAGDKADIPAAESNAEINQVCFNETKEAENLVQEYVKDENLHEKKIEIIQKARAAVLQINDEDLKQISDDPKKPKMRKTEANQDPKQFENRFSSINAVPKIRFRGQFQTNQKRNTIDLGQFEPAKINTKFKNIFENKGSNEDIEVRRQPRKKLITLDQVLIKSSSQEINHEKEVELEIVKNLRKNWVPPEDLNIETTQTKLEPKKLQIAHVYGNDSRGGTEKLKIERQSELEEVRQSAPLAARWRTEDTGDAEVDGRRSRPRSAMKVTQSDDFWLKEKSDEKVEEEKLKVYKEIESIKQARLKFEDEPENRQENEARIKTLQELESLRSNQKQLDNSVKKIKRDLEEINRNVAEKENNGKISVVDFQTPTEQWKQEREKIKETYNTKIKFEEEVKPVMASPTKLIKIHDIDDLPEMPKDIELPSLLPSPEPDIENKVESIPLEEKAKSKLKELKNMEIFKLKEKTIKLTKKIEAERGRKRELKKTETKETATIRSKSISTLKNAGQKIKSLTNDKLKAVRKSKGGEDHEVEETKVDD